MIVRKEKGKTTKQSKAKQPKKITNAIYKGRKGEVKVGWVMNINE